MADKTPQTPSDSSGRDKDTTIVMLQTIGDTTWRMFVPSVGFTLLGVWLDGRFGTKPWLMVVGIIIGAIGAFLLVAKQINGLKRGGKV